MESTRSVWIHEDEDSVKARKITALFLIVLIKFPGILSKYLHHDWLGLEAAESIMQRRFPHTTAHQRRNLLRELAKSPVIQFTSTDPIPSPSPASPPIPAVLRRLSVELTWVISDHVTARLEPRGRPDRTRAGLGPASPCPALPPALPLPPPPPCPFPPATTQ